MRNKRTPREWVSILSEFGDLLVLIALFSTREFFQYTLLTCLSLYVAKWILNLKLTRLPLVGFLISLFIFCLVSIFIIKIHPITVMVNAAPFFLYLLGASAQSESLVGWRMGLGLIILTLSAAVSFEFLLPVIITVFIINASLNISLFFISIEFEKRGGDFPFLKKEALPSRFLRNGFMQSGFVFLTAGVIFPLLPRLPSKMNFDNRQDVEQGYTEEVNTSKWNPYQKEGSSQVALRLYNHSTELFENLIPFGLLRSRVLELYSDQSWTAVNHEELHVQHKDTTSSHPEYSLQIIREGLNTASLPAPYSATEVKVNYQDVHISATQFDNNEWKDHLLRKERLEYYIATEPKFTFPKDLPRKIHVTTAQKVRAEEIKALSKKIFEGKKTVGDKITALHNYFAANNFKPSTPGDPVNESEDVLTHFLFSSRTGHCELYAGASALLLRYADVPARVISGFKISRWPTAEILTLRMSDAHAWIEVFDEKKGWVNADFTPHLLWEPGIGDWARDEYDYLSGRWFELILNYGDKTPTLGQTIKEYSARAYTRFLNQETSARLIDWGIFSFLLLFTAFILSILVISLLRRKFFHWKGSGTPLYLIYLKFKKDLIFRTFPKRRKDLDHTEWFEIYEYIRFGKHSSKVRKIAYRELSKRTRLFTA